MKKVALSLAVLFAAALVSCGNKENAEEATTDTTTIEAPADTTVAEEAPADTTAAEAAPAAEEAPADTTAAQQ